MTYEQEWDGVDEVFESLRKIDPEGLSPSELDNLVHHLTAVQLVKQLQQKDAPPGLLQAALRFLKDNDISALPVPGSAQKMLEEKLGDSLPFPRKTGS